MAAVEQTVSGFGRLNTFVNNAGVMLLGPALESPTDEWDRIVALNVDGSSHVTHTALPHAARAGPPRPRHRLRGAPIARSGVISRARRSVGGL